MPVTHEWQPRFQQHLFTVEGEVDLSTADVLSGRLLLALLSPASTRVCLNMAAVRFIDSTGWGMLEDLGEIAAALGKSLLVVEPSERVLRVIRLLGRGAGVRQVIRPDGHSTYLRCDLRAARSFPGCSPSPR